jgi:transcriptional regulator GlxA family with amidase domain
VPVRCPIRKPLAYRPGELGSEASSQADSTIRADPCDTHDHNLTPARTRSGIHAKGRHRSHRRSSRSPTHTRAERHAAGRSAASVHAGSSWTTSVCTGSLLLGAAGLLKGLSATTHWAAVDALESFGAIYTPERVVFQDTIVTAAGVSSGIDMALDLVARIADTTTAEAVQLAIEYDPQPSFDAGAPAKAPQAAKDLIARGIRRWPSPSGE